MIITSLIENTTCKYGIGTEHGLSLLIETGKRKILFDMGQTGLFEKNAAVLGIDLSTVDFAVISHGHYDHGGGLKQFLEINDRAKVYLSQYAFGEYYHGKMRYIGLDQSLRKNKRLIYLNSITEIEEGIVIYPQPEFPSTKNSSPGFTRKEGDDFFDEDFRHELYLVIREKEKRVLFSGCSHRGIIDITEYFKPDVLIGGFHFSKLAADEKLIKAAESLNRFSTTYYTCHCTGTEQFQVLKKKMERLYYLSAGDTVEL